MLFQKSHFVYLFMYFMNLGGVVIAVVAGDPMAIVLGRHCAIKALMGPVLQIV